MNNRSSAIFSVLPFVPYDFDADEQVVSSLNELDLEKNKHLAPVDVNSAVSAASRALARFVYQPVYAENAGLVQGASRGSKKEFRIR